ncbi:MAG: hypothetical protein A2750_02055 [Candidatus Yanofskybacteria bacterium RIFCSPHIGHO2_01_FULL_45_42]|uniref:Single-stranded DNA-binding protein n=3 Tax=Candidatus Yanofskyibacteriota TaxID=1752733 RepID=A0A1F8F779_9BACT|nr:MAG: hypothetical protein A2750_02055 [Candidatus Yanofskybacteria bacterium RIFCSPHIGHO2_01_FULL_45_42]OGN15591.1 MAG: hypothetical protein A3C81_00440 [Candidatus Yanofskybacteria bacterium RIFCSPHIGHO2_02_FULL_46_19]OGN27915.1 MAG: hypothetical protein A3B17_01955 [Candidatus Yanofskybacteria bacterium RIFCSPLOWO2_01_FULL_45_72]OGN32227.1 MAG: hypothetical protein A3J01_01430 [Candidatus Yanofskybacteria bacterium RIFCSPLOWO2_02_FULL_45_18]
MNLNKVYLIGRLTQDPETRAIPSGQTVTTLRMATNRVWNDNGQKKEVAEYHTIVAWGRIGEIASQYLRRGGLLMVEGRIQTRSWTGQDNVKRYMTEVVAESLQLGPRSGNPEADARSVAPAVTDIRKPSIPVDDIPIIDANEPVSHGVDESEVKIKEEDLPF